MVKTLIFVLLFRRYFQISRKISLADLYFRTHFKFFSNVVVETPKTKRYFLAEENFRQRVYFSEVKVWL